MSNFNFDSLGASYKRGFPVKKSMLIGVIKRQFSSNITNENNIFLKYEFGINDIEIVERHNYYFGYDILKIHLKCCVRDQKIRGASYIRGFPGNKLLDKEVKKMSWCGL